MGLTTASPGTRGSGCRSTAAIFKVPATATLHNQLTKQVCKCTTCKLQVDICHACEVSLVPAIVNKCLWLYIKLATCCRACVASFPHTEKWMR